MADTFDDNKGLILEELKKKISVIECPFCKNRKFLLGGGYFAHDLQASFKNRQMGGVNIPTVPIICENCGYVAEFAAGRLGILPKEEPPKEDKEA